METQFWLAFNKRSFSDTCTPFQPVHKRGRDTPPPRVLAQSSASACLLAPLFTNWAKSGGPFILIRGWATALFHPRASFQSTFSSGLCWCCSCTFFSCKPFWDRGPMHFLCFTKHHSDLLGAEKRCSDILINNSWALLLAMIGCSAGENCSDSPRLWIGF